MPLGWWHSALAVPIQDHLIGIQSLKNEDAVHRALTGNESAGLLSAAFLDLYLPWQPNLLLALLCLLIASLLSLLLLLGMLVRTRFSRFLAVNGQMGGTSEDEKTPQRQPRFRLLLCFCVVLWLLLLAGSVLFSSTLVELISVGGGGHGQEEPMAASEALLMDEEMAAAAAGREQRSEDGAAGEMLGKFEELRELGYQFRSLLSPSLFSGWMSFGFLLLLLLLLCSLLTSFLAILIGLNQRFRHYKPMDHLSAKGFVNATAQRVRRLLMVTGIALLCASPALIALSSALLVHSHGHSAVCELEQRMSQDAAMTAHILAKFSEEERTTTLPELMAEFSKEREALNGENCRRERAPLEGLWSSGLWLAFCAAPLGLCLLLLSDGWATGDGEGSVSLRAYVPGWLQNSALTPDAYASIPELQQSQFYPGTGGRHPSSSLSQCSFGTGTFVYKKY